MGFGRRVEVLPVLAILLCLRAASPYLASEASLQYGRRDDTPSADEASRFPSCEAGTDSKCRVSTLRQTIAVANPSKPQSKVAGALHNPKLIDQIPSTRYVNEPIYPTGHFFYFFENDQKTASFVANVLRGVAACAAGHDCPFNSVLCGESPCDGACPSPAGRYAFVKDPNQITAQLSDRTKVGVVFHLPPGDADSIGYALLGQNLQTDVITRPNGSFQQQTAWMQTFTGSHTDGAPWTLEELGFDTNRDGLGGKAIANLENHRRFAV
ncbi:MAG: hypothetical protein Q9188_005847 [Gyalolechia gomerana]